MTQRKNEITKSFKEFEYYIVFQDSNQNYIMAYGYTTKPAILELKYAMEQLAQEPDLRAAIADFDKVLDYISFDVMKHKKFVKYMEQQEKMLQDIENKKEKNNADN